MIKHFSFLILLTVVALYCAGQKVKLALNLSRGNTYYLNSSATSENIQIANGRQIKLSLTLTFRMAFKVAGVTDSVYTIEAGYQLLRMKMLTGDLAIEIISGKNDSLDVASQIVTGMMNRPFNITLTKTGRVLSVNSVENMIDSVFERFPQIEAAKKMLLNNQFKQTFGAKALKGNLEICTAIFPATAVAKHDSWVVNTQLETITTAGVQTTYQLIDATGNSYQLHGDGIINGDKNAGITTMDGLPVKYTIGGTTLTDIKADKTTGWVTELKLRQLIGGSVQIQDNPKVPGGAIIPLVIKAEQTITAPGTY